MNQLKKLEKKGKTITYTPSVTSIANLLEHHARVRPQKPALVDINVDKDERSEISYKQLKELVLQVAAFLVKNKVSANDRVAILMHNSLEIILIELACGLIGATTVPLDFKRDTLERKKYKLADTQTKLLFIKTHAISSEIEELAKVVPTIQFDSFSDFKKLLAGIKFTNIPTTNHLKSLYLILYTSGTTALPKGVPLTAQALIANAEGIADWQNMTDTDRFNIILPLHHINSTTMSLATLLAGGSVVLSSRYSASKFWSVIAHEKCTLTSVVPTIIHDLLVREDEFKQNKPNISSMKRILIGSAPVLPEETARFYKTFHIRVVQGYGQTETALRVTGVPVDISENDYRAYLKSNTIGAELKNCNVAIIKSDGTTAQEKEAGEICIRGPILTEGYLNNPQATKESFYDGWFHSGDLGFFEIKDGKKLFFIIGRIKEIIIKGGVNLSPAAIEDMLLKNFPAIDEVSVVGFTDQRMGEEIAAVIVPHAQTKTNLTQAILDKAQSNDIPGLSPYEMPQKVFLTDILPKTSTGKIQRVQVKKIVAEKIKHETSRHFFIKKLSAKDTLSLKQALKINNDRWQGLPSTLKEFTARATNGLLFGVFEEKEGLIGSISCTQMNMNAIQKLKTWDEAAAHGALSNYDPNGDSIVCMAISVQVKSSSQKAKMVNEKATPQLQKRAQQEINAYVQSDKDHVLNFHKKPKGGLPGARVWKIIEKGRPEDQAAMGYNVLMKYPDPTSVEKVSKSNTSPSVMLIEHVLTYANQHGIKNVIAFSRPSGFRNYLLNTH